MTQILFNLRCNILRTGTCHTSYTMPILYNIYPVFLERAVFVHDLEDTKHMSAYGYVAVYKQL
jgi:hypothetical protein